MSPRRVARVLVLDAGHVLRREAVERDVRRRARLAERFVEEGALIRTQKMQSEQNRRTEHGSTQQNDSFFHNFALSPF